MKRPIFAIGEYYHIFNRGVDKREIFSDKYDAYRFIQSLKEFNNIEHGNDIIFARRRKEDKHKCGCPTTTKSEEKEKLVNIVCYCLISNHFHLILEELVEGGISEFMKRLGGGYSYYYNDKNDRSGALFQGKFKAVHIRTDTRLQELSAYVNLNNKVHKKFEGGEKNFLDLIPNRSSWKEYIGGSKYNFCKKDGLLVDFKNKKDYKKFAEDYVRVIREDRYDNEF